MQISIQRTSFPGTVSTAAIATIADVACTPGTMTPSAAAATTSAAAAATEVCRHWSFLSMRSTPQPRRA